MDFDKLLDLLQILSAIAIGTWGILLTTLLLAWVRLAISMRLCNSIVWLTTATLAYRFDMSSNWDFWQPHFVIKPTIGRISSLEGSFADVNFSVNFWSNVLIITWLIGWYPLRIIFWWTHVRHTIDAFSEKQNYFEIVGSFWES